MDGAVERLHATAVAVGQRALIIRGPSGSGKSDLALRCLSLAASPLVASPARLVADDQVLLTRDGLSLIVTAPQTLLGRLEVRGLGILQLDPVQDSKAILIVDLVEKDKIERYPDPWPEVKILGLYLPRLCISAFESSAPLKLLAALGMPSLPPVRDAS